MMATMTVRVPEEREQIAPLLVAIVLAILIPPLAYAITLVQVIRLRHRPQARRPWAWVMLLAFLGSVLWVLFMAQRRQ